MVEVKVEAMVEAIFYVRMVEAMVAALLAWDLI